MKKQKQPKAVVAPLQLEKALDEKVISTAEASFFVDLPQEYWTVNNFGDTIGDYPRVKLSVYTLVQTVFSQAKAQGLKVRVTSALRKDPQWKFSCHFLGEAVDIVVSPANSANVASLVKIGYTAGFGYVLDEYSTSSGDANGSNVHMQLTPKSCTGRDAETPPATEYHMPTS